MYFKLNNFTGRLTGSTHIQPYFPIGVSPLSKNEPPKIIFQDKSVKPVQQTVSRYASGGGSALYATLKKKQEIFQKPDGLPVHLKGGPVDKALYAVTLAMCVIGVAASLHTLYNMSYPKKP